MKSYDDDRRLAAACASGDEAAWERFVREYRPVLYRAADALAADGGARELADALYADLYGLKSQDGERQSLFRYYQGRSSLATWLRAVLAQRYVDRVRARRRLKPLPAVVEHDRDDARGASPLLANDGDPDPDRPGYLAAAQQALHRALGRLNDRDRLRLGCYYAQGLTLAETGRALAEHEATVSRQLARTRRALREDVERQLRETAGFNPAQVAECLAVAADDAGALDVFGDDLVGTTARKNSEPDRSI